METVVIIGGGASGMAAALAVAETPNGYVRTLELALEPV